MKEMTDQELINRISQVFDDFQDPASEQGWQELRKKYPEKNARPLPLWWASAAALVLLVAGFWFLAPEKPAQTMAVEQSGIKQTEPQDEAKKEIETDGGAESVDVSLKPAAPFTASKPQANRTQMPVPFSSSDQLIAGSAPSSAPLNTGKLVSSGLSNSGSGTTSIELTLKHWIRITNGMDPNTAALIELPHANEIGRSAVRDSLINVTAQLLALAKSDPLSNSKYPAVEESSYVSRKTSEKAKLFSFFAGSYFNYALGSETKVNFGAGFTSDIKLADGLRLSTGLALANNSLTYNNGVPASGNEKLYNNALLPSFGLGNNNLTTITKYDARLLNLDIPINLKYYILPQANKLYVSAGLSSGTYLNEIYSLNYRNYSALSGAYAGQTQGAEIKKQLQSFDFARTLNLSFGFSTNLTKNQNITLEPFLKYPLGGLGSEDLKFGSSGINLKLNFSSLKKK